VQYAAIDCTQHGPTALYGPSPSGGCRGVESEPAAASITTDCRLSGHGRYGTHVR
jgi:hypothetical protein